MNATDSLTEFIAQNHKAWGREPAETLAAYLCWHDARGLLATSLVGEDVFAVCTVRFFPRLEDWLVPWVFDPDGAFCMIDLMVAVSPLAMADCFQKLVGRWGSRPVILWERGPRTLTGGRPPRIYRWDQFLTLARRITYGTLNR
jgi:hypothetical protein